MDLGAAAVNLAGKLRGGVADLRRMPRDVVAENGAVLHRYRPDVGAPDVGGAPVLLVPPLGAPDFAYDLRRGCSLVEHLLAEGRTVYLVDYGAIRFAERGLGMEHWVDEVVPWAVRETVAHAGADDLHLLGWSLGGIFSMLTVAAWDSLPVRSLTVIGSPVDIAAVPLVAPLRPLVVAMGGRGLPWVHQAVGSFPAPIVSAAFQLTAFEKLVTKPLTLLSRLDDRDCLAQIEAVDHMMNNMHGYPGRVFGQLYHLLLRSNDLSDGQLALAGRTIPLAAIEVPVLVVAGRTDVIAPMAAVAKVVELLTGAPEVRFETAPGGHLGVLTGRDARTTTWFHLDTFLTDHG
ncbi:MULTISPECIES: alpha/beta hydrolase [unclassified Pseudonocardia]|jgi:polyhydroxyalkanoate synthase|uniref:alpha/beta hydrolase n=1 Tax=unclassified Pseudonocardia TaxID=2619320 RepID=UPI00095F3DA9|nr:MULTISPECIES: alpha/beta hydrolase [unclassified Pseudonocardia]MBN9101762.1 alpha/beta hydrolase [Pseudonocardia sp.]OJY49988.1 MAG: alpha/beta hydrolase [Pseudonocardia sp. 73-21]